MKKLTRNEVAAKAKVSPSTVSRVLSGSPLIPEKTAEKIRRIALQMGYKPNLIAKRLASKRSWQIGFAMEFSGKRVRKGPIQLGYYSGILDGVISAAYPDSYSVVVQPYTAETEEEAKRLIEHYQRREIDGFIFASLHRKSKFLPVFKKSEVPFVIIGLSYSGTLSVSIDYSKAYRKILDLIKSRGKNRIVFIGGDKTYDYAAKQEEALLCEIKKSEHKLVKIFNGDYSWRCGYGLGAQISHFTDGKTVAIFANDRMATGFYRYCAENKIKIPDQIAVIGADKDPVATGLFPTLTTIVQPRLQMGIEAFHLLKKLIEEKKKEANLIIEQEILLGESI